MYDRDILRGVKVLYVEDERSLRTAVYDGLKFYIDDVTIACDGKEGLDLYTQNYNQDDIAKFDIVISDINMPVMDGIEMSRHIKELNIAQDIIITTAFNDSKYLLEAIDMKVNKYVLKPIDLDILLENIYDAYLPKYQEKLMEDQRRLIISYAKETAIRKLFVSASHHWRQPLNHINLLASKLRLGIDSGAINSDDIKKDLENISNSSIKLSNTIENFKKTFTTTEDSAQKVGITIRAAMLNFNDLIASLNINVEINGIDSILKAPQSKFMQAVGHVLLNSIEQFEEIETKRPKIYIDIFEDSNEIMIIDNAGGLKDSIKGKEFDLYSSTKSLNNRGLGLYFAKMLIDSMGGSISIEDFVNGSEIIGTKVVISLR
jgi:CheY-like chemotaxis protein